MLGYFRCFCLVVCLLLVAAFAQAGGVDPRDMPPSEPVKREKVKATPAQTSAAVSKARQAVAPAVKEEQVTTPQPRAVVAPRTVTTPKAATGASRGSWMLSKANGSCSQLSAVKTKVNVGSFTTPKEFARKMQQRGYQAFALDIGDVPDQVIRVKVPDQNVDLTFVRAGLCR